MKNVNYRKVVVGDSFSYCIKYVKGSTYKLNGQSVQLTDIIESEQMPDSVDIYVSNGSAKLLWKTIPTRLFLETEYDLNFG